MTLALAIALLFLGSLCVFIAVHGAQLGDESSDVKGPWSALQALKLRMNRASEDAE